MAEKIEIWGVKVNESCYHHLKIVKELGAGSRNEHKRAKESVEKLIENDCKTALRLIVEEFSGSTNSRKQELVSMAHEGI